MGWWCWCFRKGSGPTWLPLFLFSILFGLSMDYHVFLLSRIRERFIQTGDNNEAVAFGLRSTGRLITGAALIMVAVFGGFALGDPAMMQQFGFGLAVAVFMDATIVRSMLVPATMRLLGNWNRYFPTWLEWLPKVAVGERGHEEPEAVAEPAPAYPAHGPCPCAGRRLRLELDISPVKARGPGWMTGALCFCRLRFSSRG